MSRLRKIISNHVSPYVNNKVEDLVVNPDLRKEEDRDESYFLADQLFNDSNAYIQHSHQLGLFADAIRSGCYDYISSIEEANNHWEEWLIALHSFLADIKVTAKKKTINANKEQMIAESYQIAKKLVNALPIVPRVALIELLAQDIERGDFDDISPLQDAQKHWTKWLERARSIMKHRNVVLDYR